MKRIIHQTVRSMSTVRQAGLLFDVDGVLLKGGHLVFPAAQRALKKLQDAHSHFLFPVAFVTNAGGCHRDQKAERLSHLLQVQISPEQVVLSHSPLQMLKSFHEKCVLVSGQGPIAEIATSLGFRNVVTVEQIRDKLPLLDMVDHNQRPTSTNPTLKTLPKIEAIVLFGEPIRWEMTLQLLVDVLLTNGSPDRAYTPSQWTNQLPVLACNPDLLWLAEAPSPRFGHGMFLACLESVYRKWTGMTLQYKSLLGKPNLLTYQYAETLLTTQNQGHRLKDIYAIGDNVLTDIYGANLYNRHLSARPVAAETRLVAEATGGHMTTTMTSSSSSSSEEEEEEEEHNPTKCHSILVCTGVYSPDSPLPSDSGIEAELLRPTHLVEDVEEAVDIMLRANR